MHIKIIASAAVLALGFAGAAFAQASTTVNGLTVTEVDLPRVQAYCDQLAAGAPTEATDPAAPAAPGDTSAVGTNDPDDANNPVDDSEPTIDLSEITLEGCVEAGLATAAM